MLQTESRSATASTPPAVDTGIVRELRQRESLSQVAFARRYGFTSAAVSAWEQGRKKPGRAARLLFALIAREPEAVRRALAPEIVETT